MAKLLRQFFWLMLMLFGSTHLAIAQNTSLEFWPETEICYRLSPSWRLAAFVPITKYNEIKDRDLNIYLQADYAFGQTKHLLKRRLMDENRIQVIKTWLIRRGFMEGWNYYVMGTTFCVRGKYHLPVRYSL
jgi:hypothetical protein